MAFTKGQKVTLNKTAIYVSSDAKAAATTKTGTFYIWSATVINSRIRITDKAANAGRAPAGTYVTGWVNTNSIAAIGSTTTTSTTTTPTTSKTTTPTTTTVTASDVTPTTTVPGQIGYLGLVLFTVSTKTVQTLNSFKWSSSANYAEHARHLQRSMVEYTGTNADIIAFNIVLSAYLGSKPMEEYVKLLTYQRNGTAVPLKIGTKVYGFYRWVIESLAFNGTATDSDGDWTEATVNVSLKAYEK
ncbi:MAG: phage tail protein [Clostridia bacterium]|nr:phage tail protein [Clostridia bacterium]